MNKNEFIASLSQATEQLNDDARDRTIAYYTEMIDDRCDGGMSEEQAVYSLGAVDEIAKQIIADAAECGELKQAVNAVCQNNNTVKKGASLGSAVLGVFSLIGVCILCMIVISFSLSIWGSDISLLITGLTLVLTGITTFSSTTSAGIFLIGIGLVILSLGIALCVLCVKLSAFFYRHIKSLFQKSISICKGELN